MYVNAKVIAILEFPVPTTRRELRRFLGMVGYYRAFCKKFATFVSPLTDLLSASRVFCWRADFETAFQAAKDLLCNAPVLSVPNFSCSFKLEVDASALGAGAVLIQEDETGIDHPLSYFSRKFSRAQRNHITTEKEALALLLALQHFKVYVGGSSLPVVVYTDHNPLSSFCECPALIKVQNFNLEIQHKKGSENVLADGLSCVYQS